MSESIVGVRPNSPKSHHRTLVVPRSRTSFGDRSFAAAGPRLWNTLCRLTLRQMTSYGQFRRHLKAENLMSNKIYLLTFI